MLSFLRPRSLVVLAVTTLALSGTGCSSFGTQAALTNLRGFTFAAHPTTFAATATAHAVSIQRHARQHALSSVRTIETLHHKTSRNL